MDELSKVSLKKFKDDLGCLVAAESITDLSFVPQRIFFIISNKGDVRGKHAHKNHSQFMICSQGSCLLRFDNGKELKEIILDSNDIGIEVQPGVWGEQEYLEDNTTLIVLSDYHYDEDDYLRNYNDFKDFILNKTQ